MPDLNAFNKDIITQVRALESILKQSPLIQMALGCADELNMPNWYLGAGCVAQTVWNYLCGRELTLHINDLDLVYFDQNNLSKESESLYIDEARKLLKNIRIKIDIKNQASVYLWYEDYFGYSISPYQSIEEAINTWPTTATCVAVKYVGDNFIVYTPYGLNDLFGMTVRPNKTQITQEIYMNKVARWKDCWPKLKIIPW